MGDLLMKWTLPGDRLKLHFGCRRMIAEQRTCDAKLGLCMQFSQLLKVFNFENTRVPKIIRIPWVSYSFYLYWSTLSNFLKFI